HKWIQRTARGIPMWQMSEKNHKRVDKGNGHRRFWLATILFCGVLSGCRDVGTIWSTESHPPDGQWIALAKTEQFGGPGTAGLQSTVSLKRVKGPQNKIAILMLSSQETTSIEPKVNWLTPSH